MITTRRSVLSAAAVTVCGVLMSTAAFSQTAATFPQGPVNLVVPYTPGTGADLLARIIGPKLTEKWKVPVITENRAGASGNIGADLVAKAKPDGLTLLVTATAFGTNPALNRKLPFDPIKSFTPVSLMATSALCLVVAPMVPANNLRGLIDIAKKKPRDLSYSSPGPGTPQHLTMELLKLSANIDMVHIPYKGSGGGITDLMGGHVAAMVSAVQTVAPNVQSGQLKMLGVMAEERSPIFPNVPTMKEQGFPDLVVETWYGVLAPAGTPPDVVAKLNAEFDAVLAMPDVRAALAKQGQVPAGGPPERMAKMVSSELVRWTKVVDTAKIKAD